MIQEIKTDILIIGAGPAGLSAAIYCSRTGRKTIVLKGKDPSRLALAHAIENYPGVTSISGTDLLKQFESQAVNFGTEIIEESANEISLEYSPKMISTKNHLIFANTVIFAVGKGSEKNIFPGETDFVGKGVSYCAVCDGAFYKNKSVLVFGNDDEALEDARILKENGVHPRIITEATPNEFSPHLMETLDKESIDITYSTTISNIGGTSQVEFAVIDTGGKKETVKTNAVFIVRGIPSRALLEKSGLELQANHCIKVDRAQHTSVPGIFAAGDVTCGRMQVGVAVGEGITAGLEALKYLRDHQLS